MTKKNLLAAILLDPAHYYRLPADVLRDRRFPDEERAAILNAWRATAQGRAGEIDAALDELKSRYFAAG